MEHLGSEAERYLRQAVEGLPVWTRASVQDELRAHLSEAIQRRVAAGTEPARAEQESLEALGPAGQVRDQLIKVHRKSGVSFWCSDGFLGFTLKIGTLVDWLAPIKLLLRRPAGNFLKDQSEGRYDAIIERGERELRERGPRFSLHHELGMAYSCVGDLESALIHLQAELDFRMRKPLAKHLGRGLSIASAYSNLAGVLERLERKDEAEAALRAGLEVDNRPLLLHLHLAKLLAARGEGEEALRHLEAAARDRTTHPRGKTLLLFSGDPSFDAVRSDPRGLAASCFRRSLVNRRPCSCQGNALPAGRLVRISQSVSTRLRHPCSQNRLDDVRQNEGGRSQSYGLSQ